MIATIIFICGKAQAQDTALVSYAGIYIFPDGSPVPNATVSVSGDKLEISAAIGVATLKRKQGDEFSFLEYEGEAKFLRNDSGLVSGVKIKLPAADIDLEGLKGGVEVAVDSVAAAVVTEGPANREPFVKKGAFDIEAHQGGCGLYPCNTIPAFINAVKLGVHTLELDCVISKDNQVLVSHDQFMNATMRMPSGSDIITKQNQLGYNIFTMPYDSVRRFDAGSRSNPEFPRQQKLKTYKPLLAELFDSVENYIAKHNLPSVRYNIEIKSLRGDNVYHPAPEAFTDLVVKEIIKKHLEDRVIIQSFDVRALKYLYLRYPSIRVSYLVSNKSSLQENIDRLGFVPDVYSPEYRMVTPELVAQVRDLGINIIPWTVDEKSDIEKIVGMGVDGIISNYPDRVLLLKH